jgi:hypothetical protein
MNDSWGTRAGPTREARRHVLLRTLIGDVRMPGYADLLCEIRRGSNACIGADYKRDNRIMDAQWEPLSLQRRYSVAARTQGNTAEMTGSDRFVPVRAILMSSGAHSPESHGHSS